MVAPVVTAQQLRGILEAPARAHRIDMVGVLNLPRPLTHAPDFLSWLREGRHGGLDYMSRDP